MGGGEHAAKGESVQVDECCMVMLDSPSPHSISRSICVTVDECCVVMLESSIPHSHQQVILFCTSKENERGALMESMAPPGRRKGELVEY